MKEKSKNIFKAFSQEKKDSLTPHQIQMIENIQKLVEKEAADIMTPRIDVITFELGINLSEVLTIIQKYGFSRYPVWQENIDNIIGFLYVKDLLYYLANIYPNDIKELLLEESLLRQAFFIPETKNIESLLAYFQQHKVHIANILDEYGGFSGIVTLEDVIEVIAGDIQDEYDREEEEIYKLSPNVFIVEGRTPLDLIEERLLIEYPEEYKEEVDSIGGLLFMVLDRMPSLGERIEINGIFYQIVKQEKNKILSVKILIPQSNKTES